jgi:hypothetical protein
MSTGKNRTVFQQGDKWANKRNDADKASSLHNTQKQAIDAAKEMLKNQGGGEVTVQKRDGKFGPKDTVAPAKDPFPPRG